MTDDLLRRVLRRFGRPAEPVMAGPSGVEHIDERLDRVERQQAEINARLRLLETQADPRGILKRRPPS